MIPSDLHGHACLRFRFGSGPVHRWEFGRDGQEIGIDVGGPLVCNDTALLLEGARQGVGLAHVIDFLQATVQQNP